MLYLLYLLRNIFCVRLDLNVRFPCVKDVFRLPTGADFASQILRLAGKLFFVVNSVPKWVLRAGIVKNNGKPVPGRQEVVAAERRTTYRITGRNW